jgi:membrane protein DedA with SNARE-associated domain
MLNQKKVEKSEKYFDEHGMVATISGRLIPGIRHLISIPAGLAKMTFWKFLLYTTIGAGAWNIILAVLGLWLHSFVPEEQLENKISEYGEYIKFTIMAIVAIALIYFLIKWYINRQKSQIN